MSELCKEATFPIWGRNRNHLELGRNWDQPLSNVFFLRTSLEHNAWRKSPGAADDWDEDSTLSVGISSEVAAFWDTA